MKETKFIEQNKNKWADFESLSKSKHKDSNQYSKLYIQITDDLSYARTFYSNRSVRVYLNNLAQDIFHKIFSRNKKKHSFFKEFWMEELPAVMYYHRTELFISFSILIISIAIGLLTYHYDNSFATRMLGEGYVQMTAENIAKKEPMGVYKSMSPLKSFFYIAINNLRVDILTFFYGIIFSIGSVLVLIQNGLMLSAFQFYFIKRGLFWDSFLAVWLHGTLEISAMVICGAAGLVLGKGLVFPGTYSRMQAFFSSAQRATKIFFSVLPITIVAAVIESFLTRYTDVPDAIRLALIIVSLLFILGYYIYLPWLKKRNGTLKIPEAEKVIPEQYAAFDFNKIKNLSDIILDTFRLFRKYSSLFLKVIFWTCLLFLTIGITINKAFLLEDIYYTSWTLSNLDYFFIGNIANYFSLIIPILLTSIALTVSYIFYLEKNISVTDSDASLFIWLHSNKSALLFSFLIQIFFYVLLSFTNLSFYALLFILPLQFIGTFVLFFPFYNKSGFLSTFFTSLKSGVFNLFLLNLTFLILSTAFFFLISTSVYWMIYEAVSMNLTNDLTDSDTVFLVFFLIAITAIITLSFIFICIYQGVFYFSQKEKHTAEGLIVQINKIGNSLRKYEQ